VERALEHGPTIVVRNGRLLRENLRRERLSLSALRAPLRAQGVASLAQLRYVVLEENGRPSVIRRPPAGS
jgi:uncharacterized membrane protein YcaP (DUF421 family)